MPALSEYTNVYATVLAVIAQKGYQVWFDATANLYYAEKDGWDFASPSPCGLLGLIGLYEFVAPAEYREYWWRSSPEGDHRMVPNSPQRSYASVITRKRPSK